MKTGYTAEVCDRWQNESGFKNFLTDMGSASHRNDSPLSHARIVRAGETFLGLSGWRVQLC